MDQTVRDAYFKRYEEIRAFIVKSFYDLFILEGIESYNAEIQQRKKEYIRPAYIVIKHLCQVVMEDLALSICKVYTDQSKKGNEANTLFQLNSFIYGRIPPKTIQLPKVKKKLDKELETTIDQLKEMRNQFIAHLDNNHSHFSIPIKEIRKVLYALKDMLNGLCIKEIDARVEPLDDDTLISMQNDIIIGTKVMLNGGAWPIHTDTSSNQMNLQ